mgnify:FL=1
MALQLGYKYLPGIAGVFAMSSFLGTHSAVFEVKQCYCFSVCVIK